MKPRFVLIGCGRIARRHARQINRTGILVGVCDPDSVVLSGFTEEFPVPAFKTVLDLFNQIQADIAVICSPNGLHAEHTLLALTHGLHVLCEKPILLDADLADLIRQAQMQSGKKVYSVLSARFHPVIQQFKASMESGVFGKVLSFSLSASWNRPPEYYRKSSWKGKADLDGGILFTQFSHYLDALCWCLGGIHPLAVKTANFLHPTTIDTEDTGIALLQTDNGALGNLHWSVNSFHQNLEISWLILAEKATIKISGEYLENLEYELSIKSKMGWSNPFSASSPVMDRSHHQEIYEELNKALLGLPNWLPDFEEALESIRLIREIYHFSGMQVTR